VYYQHHDAYELATGPRGSTDGWINDGIQLDIVKVTEVESQTRWKMENMELMLDGNGSQDTPVLYRDNITIKIKYLSIALQVTLSKY
jgi:hypothetical protein